MGALHQMIPVTLKPGTWPGLNEVIELAGYSMECNNGNWLASDPAVQGIIDAFTEDMALAAAVSEVTDAINQHAQALTDAQLKVPTPAETALAAIQQGVSSAKLGAANAQPETLQASIPDTANGHITAISALTTVDDVFAYDWKAGW